MAFYDRFPYTNFQELNLDKILEKIGDIDRAKEASEASAAAAAVSESNAAQSESNAAANAASAATSATNASTSAQGIEDARNQINTNTARINNIIADGQSTEGNTELIDIRVGSNGVTYPTAGAAVRGQYEEVSNIVRAENGRTTNGVSKLMRSLVSIADFEQGGLSTDGLNFEENANYRCRTKCYIPVDSSKLYSFYFGTDSDYDFSISYYTENDYVTPRTGLANWVSLENHDAYILAFPEGTKYIRIILRKKNDGFTTPLPLSEVQTYDVYFHFSNWGANMQGLPVSNGNYYANTAWINRDAAAWINTPILNTGLIILPSEAYAEVIFYNGTEYAGKLNSSNQIDQVGGNWMLLRNSVNIDALLAEHGMTGAAFAISTSSASDPITAANYKRWFAANIEISNQDKLINYINGILSPSLDDYVVGPDMVKRHVTATPTGHQISGYQSFCKYNGNYYSYADGILYKQDSNLNLLSTVEMDLGHGNSMQLDTNGHAYVSGWDDNKVYVVNLETMALVGHYDLPVSGYTTCAVDNENSLMYIFHRTSNPNNVGQYEFITWNYLNNQIISRKKINSFAAMQACDFLNGKIAVAYGLNNTDQGIFVYNTSGDMLSSFKLTALNNTEPEGICIDRDTGTLMFSILNRDLYTVSA